MHAIQLSTTGGPEALVLADVDSPTAGPGRVVVRVAAAGVNFIDVYHRTGLYPVPLPFVPGVEGAGVVEGVGAGVASLAPGDVVAWAGPPGAYAERVALPADRLVKVPAGVDPTVAAAVMLQGMTAHYLCHDTFPVRPGHVALVLAAAGGTGALLVQMIKQAGGVVVAAVGSAEKAERARAMGADHVVRYDEEDLVVAARTATGGRGVDVVYDSVGVATFRASLDSLAPRGMLVLYGQSSGKVPPLDPGELASRGSLFLTRPSLFHYVATRAELDRHADAVLGGVAAGTLRVTVQEVLPLARAGDAHRILEGRGTQGKLLLAPA